MKVRTGCLLAFLALACGAAGVAYWLHGELTSPFYGGQAGGTFVEIPRGANPHRIATQLAAAGILHSELPFTLYVRWTGAGRHLQAGEYRFTEPATPAQVVGRLRQGDVYYSSVTIPEGFTAAETIELICDSGIGDREQLERSVRRVEWIQDLDPGARSLEGYLFPDTYRFPRRAGADQIIRGMVERFREKYGALTAGQPVVDRWTTHRIVTLASIIEKEVGTAAERPLVSSVFANRLEAGIPLGSDPTIIYALKLSGRWNGNLRKADLQIDSPYNTYVRAGLPPGPIANPGAESLRAALSPARTDFLYFVSRNDGTHQFSEDYRTHEAAVLRYQKSRAKPPLRANAGRARPND